MLSKALGLVYQMKVLMINYPKFTQSQTGSEGKGDKSDKSSPMDTEAKLDELRNSVRRAEVSITYA